MRYYFGVDGLTPITCSTEELFESLCDNTVDNKYKHLMLRYLDDILDDGPMLFIDSKTTTQDDIANTLVGHGRNVIQATFDFHYYDPVEERPHGLIFSRIDYQKGYAGYTANVYLVSHDFMNTLIRRQLIDEALENI